jgi:cell division protein FtsL
MLAVKQTTVRETQTRSTQHTQAQTRARTRSSLRDRLSLGVCLVTCVGAGWFIASTGARIDKLSYSVDSMQTQIQKTQAENASLTSKVDELMRPSRILGIALGRLHMQYADPVQIQSGSH